MYRKKAAEDIKATRKKLGMTLAQFAAAFNAAEPLDLSTTLQDVHKYERGVNQCPAPKYLKFMSMAENR